MEVDESVTPSNPPQEFDFGNLETAFSRLATADKDTLVQQLQQLIGGAPNTTECAFLLDMCNWNVAEAAGLYFDLSGNNNNLTGIQHELRIERAKQERIEVHPENDFTCEFVVTNAGATLLPSPCGLRHVGGETFGNPQDIHNVITSNLRPLETIGIGLRLRSPKTPGVYYGQWRIVDMRTGQLLGAILQVEVSVLPPIDGLTMITEQFATALAPIQEQQIDQD